VSALIGLTLPDAHAAKEIAFAALFLLAAIAVLVTRTRGEP